MGILVFISVLLVAACGLIYELVAGTLASYLVGDSVFQFSTIIGTYLFAMGIGSALSRYINRGLANRFVCIELLLGVIGGVFVRERVGGGKGGDIGGGRVLLKKKKNTRALGL